jgi:hydrogenase/urease accessory protein HupE
MQRIVLLLVALLAATSPPVMGHEVRPAYLQIEEKAPNRFEVLWKQPSRGGLVLRLAPKVSNGLLDVAADEEYATEIFVIRRWSAREATRESFDGATVRIDGLERTLTDAFVTIAFASGQQVQTLIKPANPEITIQLTGTGNVAVPKYLALGVEHILTGFDHLAFVLGLVLLVRGRMRLVATITAFTVAHSITLALAALGYYRLSPPVVESVVALSIVFVAVELARSWRGHEGITTRYPWLIAFTFGLLHGFAFAGALAEVGLPAHNVPGALLLFNCGVEIGQLLFVGIVLALVELLRRLKLGRAGSKGRWLVAYAIGAFGANWMIERIAVFLQ